MIVPLQLRHDADADLAPAAWFLPGASVEHWLEELARGGLAGMDTRLFVVPRSVSDRTPAGLLVVPSSGVRLEERPRGIACRAIAERLYAPADAVLSPPVTDAEVRVACALPVSFFHPVFGFSGFEVESTLRVLDLLEAPPERKADWNQARGGAPSLPELRTVVLAQPPTLQDIFGGAQDDIGTQPPEGLPPAPDEPKENPIAQTGRTLRRLFAQGVAGAVGKLPHNALQRTWLNNVEDWANRQLQGLSQQLEKIRNKELERLLHLFKTDPEAALRHAIPLSGFAHRGRGQPGSTLTPRSPNFNLGQLGGQAADFWDVSDNMQEVLRRQYREMADREMQLGRFRRAAYIYAQLLGDLVSAANVLKQGKHYREAALLYEEHLHNPLMAAQCLAEGGLLLEAIERYEKLGRWLDVADLQERLGDRAAAAKAVRRVVEERLAQDDIVGAAKLVEERLQEVDEALQMLLRAWPASRQAGACLTGAFQILGRLGRHEVAAERLAQLAREPLASQNVMPLLGALRGPAREYPHELVRHRSADLSRVLVARQLAQDPLPPDDGIRLMECLVRLAPQDRLLMRDANRHLAARREAEARVRHVAPPPPATRNNQPIVVRRFELPRQMEWVALRNRWHWFFAVGVTANRLTLARGAWEGDIQSVSWACPTLSVKNGLLCEPVGVKATSIAVKVAGIDDLFLRRFPATDASFDAECMAGTPPWMKPQHWPAAFGEESVWTAHLAEGRAILSCHDERGKLQQTIDVTDDLLEGAERTEHTCICAAVIGNRAAVALGNRLVVYRSNGDLQRIALPGQVRQLISTLPYTRAGLAIMMDQGASMHWVGTPGVIELDRDIHAPTGAFVPGGPLVLLSEAGVTMLEVDSRGVNRVTRVDLTGSRPIGVSATASPGQFALLGPRGEMTVYRLAP